jgi:phenylalanyl-tRNA synthetase beta chain
MCLRVQHYLDTDLKLRKFVPIIQKSAVYPVVFDSNRTVLSLPPIINSAHSAVRMLDACLVGSPA